MNLGNTLPLSYHIESIDCKRNHSFINNEKEESQRAFVRIIEDCKNSLLVRMFAFLKKTCNLSSPRRDFVKHLCPSLNID